MSTWQKAKLISSKTIGPKVKSFVVSVPKIIKHKPGQYYDIRLSSQTASRSYSIASPPKSKTIEFGIQLLQNGQASPLLFRLKPGDSIEIRGPIGNHFVWNEKTQGDIILIGGGSGVVPLMSILRAHYGKALNHHLILLVSAKTIDSILYKNEIDNMKNVQKTYILTGKIPDKWSGFSKRIDKKLLSSLLLKHASHSPIMYIAGSTSFVETVMSHLLALGINPVNIKTERFGG